MPQASESGEAPAGLLEGAPPGSVAIVCPDDGSTLTYEIEDVLLAHPAVADAVCFGIEDAKYGEVVGAASLVNDS